MFKEKHPFEKRLQEATNIRKKYPNRIPIIVERQAKTDIEELDKTKFLAPVSLTLGQFVYVIRRRMKLAPEKAIFVFIRNHIPSQSTLMSSLYDDYKDDDGFLYIVYAGENTFGNID